MAPAGEVTICGTLAAGGFSGGDLEDTCHVDAVVVETCGRIS